MRSSPGPLLLVALLFLGTAPASAGCDAWKQFGIYDTSVSVNNVDRALAFRELLCRQNFSSSGEARQLGIDLGLPIPDFPIELGLDASSAGWKKSYSSYCEDRNYTEALKQNTIQYVQKINTSVAAQVNACLTQRGFHTSIVQGAGWKFFTVRMDYTPANERDELPKIRTFTVRGATCKEAPAKDQKIGAAGWSTSCERISEQSEVSVAINASRFAIADTAMTLPPRRLEFAVNFDDTDRFELQEVSKEDCGARSVKFYDKFYNHEFNPTFFNNCQGPYGIDWTSTSDGKLLKKIAAETGLTTRAAKWALLSVSGDCMQGRVVQLFHLPSRSIRQVTVHNPCAPPPIGVDWTVYPREYAARIAARYGLDGDKRKQTVRGTGAR